MRPTPHSRSLASPGRSSSTARAGDFTSPEHRENVPWLQQLLLDTGEVHSTSLMRRRTGEDIDIEYHLETDPAVPGQWISWFRELPPRE